MQSKLADLNSKLRQNNLNGFIVTNQTNIFYLTGFRGISPQERESILIFNPEATLITARLYQNKAHKVASKELRIKIVSERNQLFEIAKELLKKARKVGFEEDDLKYGEYRELLRKFSINSNNNQSNLLSKPGLEQVDKPGLKLIPVKNLIENLRMFKTTDEIARIERAQIISQKAFNQLIKTLKIGQTEEGIAERLSKIIKSLGGQGLAFESIVASGPNAGLPHHITGKRKIKKGEVLLLDFGAKYQNYCADLSRTIFIGRSKDEHRNIYSHVKEAQLQAMTKIRHGVKLSDAYHFANNHFKKHKLDKYFLHSLGHGVGLEVHEKPHLRPQTTQPRLGMARQAGVDSGTLDEILQENMVFSVEPGLYFPWGGIRIEDLVTVNDNCARVLGRKSPELIEIS